MGNVEDIFKEINRLYTYIVGKDHIYVLKFIQRVQMNYIFSDNVCILCLSCNVKKLKTTAKLSNKNRNKHRCNQFSSDVHAYTVTVSYHCST